MDSQIDMWAAPIFHKLVEEYTFHTVLDIGAGEGEHTRLFRSLGKKVTAIDLGRSVYFQKNQDREKSLESERVLIGDFVDLVLQTGSYDAVWCSHVLEHQANPGIFLRKIFRVCKHDGVVAITVPPFYGTILSGHLTAWNAGLLLYNMIIAGFDCSEARVFSHDYDIGVIVRRKPADLPNLDQDKGDIERLAEFFPPGCRREGFDGNIKLLGW